MSYSLEKEGVLQAVMERFEKSRLPRVMKIKQQVDEGHVLASSDIEFLDEVLKDTQQYADFVSKHEEYRKLYANVTHLYNEITTKALKNEGTRV
ncbi:MAG: hypothetical protein HQL46_16280 [Gammaproteobacteria bacterium]|nr:hypothetical protein [Gammaproteobacteria bacterium]